nr:proline-rich receptor-like protein kinase PERK9 [Aegilops tauschii subsp. strangulata]
MISSPPVWIEIEAASPDHLAVAPRHLTGARLPVSSRTARPDPAPAPDVAASPIPSPDCPAPPLHRRSSPRPRPAVAGPPQAASSPLPPPYSFAVSRRAGCASPLLPPLCSRTPPCAPRDPATLDAHARATPSPPWCRATPAPLARDPLAAALHSPLAALTPPLLRPPRIRSPRRCPRPPRAPYPPRRSSPAAPQRPVGCASVRAGAHAPAARHPCTQRPLRP